MKTNYYYIRKRKFFYSLRKELVEAVKLRYPEEDPSCLELLPTTQLRHLAYL